MKHSYNDIRESELDDYVDEVYRRLKRRDYEVRVSKSRNTFMCPFCDDKGKHEYLLPVLLQHARDMGKGCRDSVKLKGKHIALFQFMDKYYSPRNTSASSEQVEGVACEKVDFAPSQQVQWDACEKVDHAPSQQVQQDDGEKFVIPWKGIVANLPLERKDGRYVGESGSKLRDELTKKGYNPTKVIPLWGPHGHSGFAIVNFSKDEKGFENALTFDKDFELNHHGKRDWRLTRFRGNEIYGWMAREEDYNANDIIGKHLRDSGDVRSLTEHEAEGVRKTKWLVSNLNRTLQVRDKQCEEMKNKLRETGAAIKKVEMEKDKMIQQFNEEMDRMRKRTIEDKEKILSDHMNFKNKLKAKEEELDKLEKFLERREADYDTKIIKLRHQRKLNELAAQQQKRSEQKVLGLIAEHEKEKEELHKKIIDLEKQIDQRQALELQIEQLRGAAQVMEHMGRDVETKEKMEKINEELQEKEEELEDLEDLAQTLIIQERNVNDQLQDARKAMISGLQDRKTGRANIGVKLMGLLDGKVFLGIAKGKYPKGEATSKANELISLCKEYVGDNDWHPFKTITEAGELKEVIDEEDERLKALRDEHGDEVWHAVKTVMSELNEYNASGRYAVPELWNWKENRKARLGEAAEHIVNLWKQKRKKK